jgi:hypothetical protein
MAIHDILQDQATLDLFKRTADTNPVVATEAQHQLAKAIELPLRQAVLVGENRFNIFEVDKRESGTTIEYPLDMIAPGEENELSAYTIPNHGYIPHRHVEGTYVTIPTYRIAGSIDWNLRYAREANGYVLRRAMEVLEAQFVKKMNDDQWHLLVSAGYDRNVVVYDADASAGFLTKRLVSLMQIFMRRHGGGNSSSVGKGKLTDIFLSPEAIEDIRNWGIDQIDDVTRREIYLAGENAERMTRIFGVNLHELYELGEGQQYQLFYNNQLGGGLPSGDVELVVGLDLTNRDSFIMPVRESVSIFADPALHRQQREGYYGWTELGFAVLDSRRVLLGSL